MSYLKSEEVILCINSWRVSCSPEFIREFSESLPTETGNLLKTLLNLNFPEVFETENERIKITETSPGLNFNPMIKEIEAYLNFTKPGSNAEIIQ
jgi:hypothetical protein